MTECLPALLSLQAIGRIEVLPAALEHYYFKEVSAATQALRATRVDHDHREPGVVGTQDNQRAELYGWVNPVAAHVDGRGSSRWMYGALLSGPCTIHCGRESIDVTPGDVFRLNDRQHHWTRGSCDSVCVFVGCWRTPCDTAAITQLQRGARKLANGVRNAPRAGPGFRLRRRDEVWASPNFDTMYMVSLQAVARFDMDIAYCKNCDDTYADSVDGHYPYFSDHYCERCA